VIDDDDDLQQARGTLIGLSRHGGRRLLAVILAVMLAPGLVWGITRLLLGR
jgi:hypothetical protein